MDESVYYLTKLKHSETKGEPDLHIPPALDHLLARSQGGGALLRTGTQEVHCAYFPPAPPPASYPASYPAPPPASPPASLPQNEHLSPGFFKASTTDWVHSLGKRAPLLSTLSPS